MSSSHLKNFLGWTLLPAAAEFWAFVIAIFIVLMIWYFAKSIDAYSDDGWFFQYALPIIFSIYFGNFYSKIAIWFAPRAKVIVATIMGLMFASTTLLVLYFICVNHQYNLHHLNLHIAC